MHTPVKRRRSSFRPCAWDSTLEERIALSTLAAAASAGRVHAAAAISAAADIRAERIEARAHAEAQARADRAARRADVAETAQVRVAYNQQLRAAVTDLRNAIRSDINQAYANGPLVTSQQRADLNAMIGGAIDATALRLTAQASLLPASQTRLIPSLQTSLLGPFGLTGRVNAAINSSRLDTSPQRLDLAITRGLMLTAQQNNGGLNAFFRTTPVAALSVDTSGQRIPIQQFLASRLVTNFGDSLGMLAQNYPLVAQAMLGGSGSTLGSGSGSMLGSGSASGSGSTGVGPIATTIAPTQAQLAAFNGQFNNALGTTMFQLGSGLSVLNNAGGTNFAAQLNPFFFGPNGLGSTLRGVQFGSSGFNSAVSGAFNNAYLNSVSTLNSSLALQPNALGTLPSTNFQNPFGTTFAGSTFNNGFNNGFITGTGTGVAGFGVSPTGFNTNFGTGFNSAVSAFNGNLGFIPSGTSTIGGVGTIGGTGTSTLGGVGTVGSTGTVVIGSGSPTGVGVMTGGNPVGMPTTTGTNTGGVGTTGFA
jgi:hypothetical protein